MRHILIITDNFSSKIYFSALNQNYIVTSVSNIYDAIYYLLYTDMQFDVTIIGDDLSTKVNTDKLNNILPINLDILNHSKYFPVILGNIINEICKQKQKTIPKIIIVTTFLYYQFIGNPSAPIKEQIKDFIETNGMVYFDVLLPGFLKTFINYMNIKM